ncbi:MAG: phosphoribosyl-AMP cyclohydrolase, partial [Bacteroidota bacterium]
FQKRRIDRMNLKDNYAAIDLEEELEFRPQFDKRGGLLPVAVQEIETGQLLMLASINEEALQKTIKTGLATFWSTSRNRLWTKGETSGDALRVDNILIDCDQDALVYQVTLLGNGVCHTFNQQGNHRKACFYREMNLVKNKLQFIKGMR